MTEPFPTYSFMEEAAAEARKASRSYWAKGGPADTAHPVHPSAYRLWKIPLVDRQLEASIKRHRGIATIEFKE